MYFRRALIGLALLASLVNLALAIYPEDHFEYSTKLTNENYEAFLKDNLAAGNLADGGPRIGQPGMGGWPTLRIFTPETGVEGVAYQKQTDMAMCDELKQESYLQGVIEQTAGVEAEVRPKGGSSGSAPRGAQL
ncbi:hypothetical protein TrVE_jg3820 [Triparma verrucosa]|uniref:Uncharacterized protein n=2 Tax=Triparma TaxID=722752 RepID=A0A9W7EKX6_9STRA|nr:hypothetical protein TrST_g8982 [Triparma strigata]GMI05250.1 hypothetical protein TrVE_jg3820 [Triparma verrucosa]